MKYDLLERAVSAVPIAGTLARPIHTTFSKTKKIPIDVNESLKTLPSGTYVRNAQEAIINVIPTKNAPSPNNKRSFCGVVYLAYASTMPNVNCTIQNVNRSAP
jgi:hypothetical protein